MTDTLTGGCKCGATTYSGSLAQVPMFRCHCRDCQQLTGTGHSEMVPLEAATFTITGLRSEYQMTGGSGQPTWSSFCSQCGSPLTRKSQRMQHMVYVHAASLDDPKLYQPAKTLWAEAAQPWDLPKDS